ncbi:outer membrane protein/peptidoglycan-associated (lipo)protein [Rivularia sp. PCC 7116]|uniref:OmpA family protein n=1 Tax=Rivularia sp. PCC 7116 TaxID=373994 RepID=UPI00029F4E6A|nr:OmpA family protein [Rivularia sp. PCC 7116]AFY56044.1 outer membrane protein/peptidoglycan-associated (lipo)protein [Rivularia sp. PCC 7116]
MYKKISKNPFYQFKQSSKFPVNIKRLLASLPVLLLTTPNIAVAQSNTAISLSVTVNSNQDGEVEADNNLTLREAIAIVNGSLSLERLSSTEQSLVSSGSNQAEIKFNLPPGQTKITLESVLPPLTNPGTIVDGTSQPGYDASKSATAEIEIPIPVVEITSAPGEQVFRGLTVAADNITVEGLSIYGFNSKHTDTASLPPGDIVVVPYNSVLITDKEKRRQGDKGSPPRNVIIKDNWLGITSEEQVPEKTSAFGVSVFNAIGTNISRNRIANHEGSAIITGKLAENTQIQSNIIVGNGIAGMPDAIRLEGKINNSQVTSNLICANDGSGVYLFKPEGSVKIQSNNIKYNGRRLRRAGVYLMGNNHEVTNNQITNQPGSGVAITAYPDSKRNVIRDNNFANIEGLSIDLNYRNTASVRDFQRGDGPNPPRNSGNRRLDSANGAINAPEFLSSEFISIDGKVNIDGKAEPGSEIDIYKVNANSKQQLDLYPAYSALGEVIARVQADEKGRFKATFTNLQPGEIISAIATQSKYGTSEPAANAIVKSVNNSQSFQKPQSPIQNPNCTSRPVAPTPIPEPPIPQPPIPEPPTPIRLSVPRNVHFALDKDFISQKSGEVLDKIAEVMEQYPNIVIELQGHTDSRASVAYNQDLARRRATNARNYLIKKGIAPERMTIRSFGERKLRTQENNVVDYARNRRVEILFFDVRGIDIEFENQEQDLQIEQ